VTDPRGIEIWVVNAPCHDPSQITPETHGAYKITVGVQTFINHGYQPDQIAGHRWRGVMNANGRISDLAPLD
jgi:hypothetical protein